MMDIGSLDKSYLTNAMSSADSLTDRVKKSAEADYSQASDEELLDVCKKFEAYFIEQVLKEVKKTVPDSTLGESSNTQLVDYFMDETLQKVSSNIQEQSGLGLAQQMYEQMKRNYSIPEASGETEDNPSAEDTEGSREIEAVEETGAAGVASE